MCDLIIKHNAPRSGLLKYWLGRSILDFFGWKVTGKLPVHERFILVGAHHTTNWDFIISLAVTFVVRLKTSWMGKHTLFIWPMGHVMRLMGGISIDRSSRHGVVDQTVNQLKQSNKLVILMAADGTRTKMKCWRSGFYRIALKAQVPVVCSYLDYEKKEACFGLSFIPTGNVKQDMDRIREFYKDVRGKYPENETIVCLKDEANQLK